MYVSIHKLNEQIKLQAVEGKKQIQLVSNYWWGNY